MSQLTHWNPFKSLAKTDINSNFEDFFRSFAMRPAWRELDLMPEIRIDVNEDDKSYKIKADIPGMKKEDIAISVDGRQVEIRAENKNQVEKKDGSCLYSERTEGSVYRSFTLPVEVDGTSAEAKYDGGVLSLTLPKKSNGNGHRITVS